MIKQTKKCGSAAHILMPKETLGKNYIVLPIEYQSILDSVNETKAKTVKELLNESEIVQARTYLKQYIKEKPKDRYESIRKSLARTYIACLEEISASDSLLNLTSILSEDQKNNNLLKKLDRKEAQQ